jgi:GTP-binding protein EngB required for normal cell division
MIIEKILMLITIMGNIMEENFLVFTGRPNSGKSSIIRRITGINTRSGKRPGTTRKISKYPLSRGLSLVDMPGYGRITGASKSKTSQVKDEILDFIELNREAISLVVHVLDLSTFREISERMERKNLIPIDLEMIQYIWETIGEMPLVVTNKIDKVVGNRDARINDIKNQLDEFIPNSSYTLYPVSALKKEGLGALKDVIHRKLSEKGFRAPFSGY